ncbi:hypothetical protein [Peribacillus kribbensis]|uniref:hypothetical protein n=1 Tax=Peribacillus kribbensis TaxID=356658 RepID=UPI000410FDAB|nr:hypothetical protein [Peribacillus kribbensis]
MKNDSYHDFANVEKTAQYLIPEEFPEGAYGAPMNAAEAVQNKSTAWKKGQRHYSAFNYENKTLHENKPRQMEGAHPTHDDPEKGEQPPYTQTGNS